ncbi:unnamed protein product [Closterium sp. NIES-65]|nr:unnamed protein product [Closterium sp. NIES-65]
MCVYIVVRCLLLCFRFLPLCSGYLLLCSKYLFLCTEYLLLCSRSSINVNSSQPGIKCNRLMPCTDVATFTGFEVRPRVI